MCKREEHFDATTVPAPLFYHSNLCFEGNGEQGSLQMLKDKAASNMHAFREAALSCPIPAAVELIGEKWAFLILRGALNGLKHFEEFQGGLGIARNILSDRLSKMVTGGILARAPDPSDRRKVVYSLTSKGEGLMPALLALRQWGEEWGHGVPDMVLADRRDGKPVRKMCVLSHDGRQLQLSDLIWVSVENQDSLQTAAE